MRANSLAHSRQDWEGATTSPRLMLDSPQSPAQMLQDSQDPSRPGGSEPGPLCWDVHTGDSVRHLVSHPRALPVPSPPGLFPKQL